MTNDPICATKQYLRNICDSRYGKPGTKITITKSMQGYIRTALEQWEFWHNRTSEVVEENAKLQECNRDLATRLGEVQDTEQLIRLLKRIIKN